MKYRDIIGYSEKQPKKKVVPEQPKPSVSELLKEEFGDTINEGPAADYNKFIKKIEKSRNQFLKFDFLYTYQIIILFLQTFCKEVY